MSVLMPNTRAGIRRAVEDGRDDYGDRVRGGWGSLTEMHEARTKENADGTWSLGLDPALWPVRVDDLVVDADGGSYLVKSSSLLRNNLDSAVDWVRVMALQRAAGGTEPGGAWFVARQATHVDPDEHEDAVVRRAGMWVGNGPPPEHIEGAQPGDEYLDVLSGTIYGLESL